MDNNQRGNLFLGKIPNPEVEKKVVDYLLSLRQDSSLENLTAKVKKAPFVLFNDISVQRALMITSDLKQLGAVASFVPYKDEGPSRAKPFHTDPPYSSRAQKAYVAPSPKGKIGKWGRLVFLLILLLISVALLLLQYYPQYFQGPGIGGQGSGICGQGSVVS